MLQYKHNGCENGNYVIAWISTEITLYQQTKNKS